MVSLNMNTAFGVDYRRYNFPGRNRQRSVEYMNGSVINFYRIDDTIRITVYFQYAGITYLTA
jgi:hypothetical protein